MRRRPVVLMLLIGVCAFAPPAMGPAAAGAQSSVIADCNTHERLTQQYSIGQLRAALSTMPVDVKEYTNCYDVIQRTLLAQLGTKRSAAAAPASNPGGSFFSAPVIAVIALLALAAAAFGALALRRRGT